MNHLTQAVRTAVAAENWHAALALALTLPDVCGSLQSPGLRSRARYVAWCEQYLTPAYTHPAGPTGTAHCFLSGSDCYALRCAVLHQGVDELSGQSAQQALSRFVFVAPLPNWTVHRNQVGTRLQVQVDMFCEDLCSGVDRWMANFGSALPATHELMQVARLDKDGIFLL